MLIKPTSEIPRPIPGDSDSAGLDEATDSFIIKNPKWFLSPGKLRNQVFCIVLSLKHSMKCYFDSIDDNWDNL